MFQSECNHAPMCFGYGCVVLSAQDVLELDVVPDFYFSMRNACPWASRFDSFTYWTWSLGLGFFLPCLLCEGSSRECSQILLAPWLAKCCTICKRQTSLKWKQMLQCFWGCFFLHAYYPWKVIHWFDRPCGSY